MAIKEGVKMVTIRLPKTKELSRDLRVWVNDESFQIQRGKDVKVPDYVATAIRCSERMEEVSMTFNEENVAKED